MLNRFIDEDDELRLSEDSLISLIDNGSCKIKRGDSYKTIVREICDVDLSSSQISFDLVIQRERDKKFFEACYVQADISYGNVSFYDDGFIEVVKINTRKKRNLKTSDFTFPRNKRK